MSIQYLQYDRYCLGILICIFYCYIYLVFYNVNFFLGQDSIFKVLFVFSSCDIFSFIGFWIFMCRFGFLECYDKGYLLLGWLRKIFLCFCIWAFVRFLKFVFLFWEFFEIDFRFFRNSVYCVFDNIFFWGQYNIISKRGGFGVGSSNFKFVFL